MNVAIPASQSVGPDGLYAASSTVKVDAPKIAAPEESGRQPDSREQSKDQPQDRLSKQLQILAQRAEQATLKEQERQQQTSTKASPPSLGIKAQRPAPQRDGSSAVTQAPLDATPDSPLAFTHATGTDPLAAALDKAEKYRETQPGPAEIYGLPDALARYDSNGDGRIDQSEMKRVSRAKDDSSSYSGLAQPRQPTTAELEAKTQAEQPKKLYAGEEPPPPPFPGEVKTQAPQSDSEMTATEDILLPGEKRLFEQGYDQPRRLYEPTEDPSARVVTGTYQQIASGQPGHTSIVT